ncbi:MAG: TetR/AcrR family transcriptional regulator [Halioglobus sp.]
MSPARRTVELLEKNKPRQERAKRTYEAILSAAAELLLEVGVERISTNLVAERAGITVPALYRYFPNKYSVLNALGAVLVDRQNKVFQAWFERHLASGDPEELIVNVKELLRETYEVTREQPGGLEIVQALLREVRLESHKLVSNQFAEIAAGYLGREADDHIRLEARLTIEMGYAVIEMALEDESLEPDALMEQGASMIQYYWRQLLGAAA